MHRQTYPPPPPPIRLRAFHGGFLQKSVHETSGNRHSEKNENPGDRPADDYLLVPAAIHCHVSKPSGKIFVPQSRTGCATVFKKAYMKYFNRLHY